MSGGRAVGWIVVVLWAASCTLADVELDNRPCPCVAGYTCMEDRCIPDALAGDGDGDFSGDADAPPSGDGDGDAPLGDGDGDALPPGDGDAPGGDGDGDGDGDGTVAIPACSANTCPECITIAAMLPCCRDDGICGCQFPGTACK